jgi:hypothetical protein
MHWQPIETAPKDGTDVLLFFPECNRHVWLGSYDVFETLLNGITQNTHEGWSIGMLGANAAERKEPTHWMPLPDPPSEA